MDSVFFDFVKLFEKVNFRVLLDSMAFQGYNDPTEFIQYYLLKNFTYIFLIITVKANCCVS